MSASFSPDGSRIVTGSDGQDGEGVGREDRAPSSSPSRGTPSVVHVGVVQPGRVADRHRRVGTGRRRCGTRRPGPSSSPSRGTPSEVVSASFSPDGSRIVTGERRQDGEGVGREDRGRAPHPQGAHRPRPFGVVQPGRVADRHRERGQDGEGVGREDRGRAPHPQGAHERRAVGVVQPGRVADRHRRADDKTAKVWDAKTGAELLTLKGHTDRVSFGVVQPGRVADRHRRARTRRRRCGTPRPGPSCSPSRGTPSGVDSASFSPDGSRIVTGSSDRTAKVWDAKTGAELLTLKGHTGGVSSASFSPDGSRIVTGELRPDGEGVGREDRGRAPHPQGAHRTACCRRRSARTGRGSSPASRGQDGEGVGREDRGRAPHPQGAHRPVVRSASFSADGSRIVTARLGPDGEGVGRPAGEPRVLAEAPAPVARCGPSETTANPSTRLIPDS